MKSFDTEAIAKFSARELARAYRDRQVSPVEVAKVVLGGIERLNPSANAFSWIDPETTLSMARASEKRLMEGRSLSLADGIPTTVKDLMLVRGWPTLRGSRTSDPDDISDSDSPCVARLREAGTVFVGKTTVPEFGWKGVNDSPLHGVTPNPLNPRLTAGGSSGGAAVAAALGLGIWHTASDAAGSIRIPAAFCGVFGIKPTRGLVPIYPPGAFSGLGHHGPIARTVDDIAIMLTIMCAPDPRDGTAVCSSVVDFTTSLEGGVEGLRIGYVEAPSGIDIDPAIVERVEAAARTYSALGAHVEETILSLDGAFETIDVLWQVGCAMLVDGISADKRSLLDPGLVKCAAIGSRLPATVYRSALIDAELLASRLNLLHCAYDLLITPVVPIEPFLHGHDVPPDSGMASWLDWTPLTYPFNLTGQPAASIPCGLTGRGLPTAFQLVGRRLADMTVLRAARAYENAVGGDNSGAKYLRG